LSATLSASPLTSVGLFAGIGGIELGLASSGFQAQLLCEIEPTAKAVLSKRFPEAELVDDVSDLKSIPRVDLLAAGFPCQDLSQAGLTAGIKGKRSGLVNEVFRLVENERAAPTWLLLENVSFMLRLHRGRAMRHLTDELDELGFMWAYRVLDSRAFGLPQRRQRMYLLASRTQDPRPVLFAEDRGQPDDPESAEVACGFCWTEGRGGLGWAADAVPTLKGGSTIGIASPPGIWTMEDEIVTPEIRDAERLQGFASNWTLPASEVDRRNGARWKLVGNAVSVPAARWLGSRIVSPRPYTQGEDEILQSGDSWPIAAWGAEGKAHSVPLSMWPRRARRQHLQDFLRFPTTPLSERATRGFLSRAEEGSLNFQPGFLKAIRRHLKGVASR
jgi:DNA (cytosine-5)-methyltransferase 1